MDFINTTTIDKIHPPIVLNIMYVHVNGRLGDYSMCYTNTCVRRCSHLSKNHFDVSRVEGFFFSSLKDHDGAFGHPFFFFQLVAQSLAVVSKH